MGLLEGKMLPLSLFEKNWSITPSSVHGSHGLFQIIQIYIKWQTDAVEGENLKKEKKKKSNPTIYNNVE